MKATDIFKIHMNYINLGKGVGRNYWLLGEGWKMNVLSINIPERAFLQSFFFLHKHKLQSKFKLLL